MRILINPTTVHLWLSAEDTRKWANRVGSAWPCSQLSGHRLHAEFDTNGLCDLSIDGKTGGDCDANEFNAVTSDYLRAKLPADHPVYFISVGQFQPC